MAIGDPTNENAVMEQAQLVCDKLGVHMSVREGNAVPVLLEMCTILTDKVLRLEKRIGNSDGRTIESVGRESTGNND